MRAQAWVSSRCRSTGLRRATEASNYPGNSNSDDVYTALNANLWRGLHSSPVRLQLIAKILPFLPVSSFIWEEVLFKSFSSKQLPTLSLGLGSWSEKRSRFRVSCGSRCQVVYQIFMGEELFHLPSLEFDRQFRFGNHPNGRVKIYCLAKSNSQIYCSKVWRRINFQIQVPEF